MKALPVPTCLVQSKIQCLFRMVYNRTWARNCFNRLRGKVDGKRLPSIWKIRKKLKEIKVKSPFVSVQRNPILDYLTIENEESNKWVKTYNSEIFLSRVRISRFHFSWTLNKLQMITPVVNESTSSANLSHAKRSKISVSDALKSNILYADDSTPNIFQTSNRKRRWQKVAEYA